MKAIENYHTQLKTSFVKQHWREDAVIFWICGQIITCNYWYWTLVIVWGYLMISWSREGSYSWGAASDGCETSSSRLQVRQVVCTAGRVFEGGLGSGKTVGAWEVFWVELITLWRALLSAAVHTMKPYVRLLSLVQLLFQLHFPNKSQEV